MEGLIGRLLDEEDATVRNLRRAATFYCIPNMNPGMSFFKKDIDTAHLVVYVLKYIYY